MPINQMLLPEFDQEMANTRKMLLLVPDDKLDFKPHPKSMALGRLASHVAELPGWAKVTLETELLQLDDFKPIVTANNEELVALFDKNVADARAAIEAASDDAAWQVIWRMKFGGNEIMAMPRVAVMRGVVMNHLIHHRAQLGVELRLLDVEIPGMYGPSADEMKFWEPAKATA